MSDINIFENEIETELADAKAVEIFLSGGEVSEDDGLVWKEVLREGQWAYRPGVGGRPTPVPLKVVAGEASSGDEISMADLQKSFEDHAVDHVTVPTSHEDKPHQNTGHVRKLRIEDKSGKKVLKAGIEFTEPDIKGKALRGTIANVSAGVIFDYVKKDSGKKFGQVLGHVALTNKPWINGMQPFGLSDEFEDNEIVPLMLQDTVWDTGKSLTWLRDKVNQAIASEDSFVLDIMPNRALVSKYSEGKEENFVVPFQIRSGDVKLAGEDKWIKATKEWVETSLSEDKDFVRDFGSHLNRLSEEAPNSGDERKPETGGKTHMSDKSSRENENDTQGAPSDSPAPEVVGLSEEKVNELIAAAKEEAKEEYETKLSETASKNAELQKSVHKMKVNEKVEGLKELGFSSQAGLLAEIRNLLLADVEGTKTLTLSEEVDGESKEVSLSATEVIERIIDSMPKNDDGKIDFGEMALSVDDHDRPAVEPDKTDSKSAAAKLADDLGIDLGEDKKEDE
jgi:hypothetical protein